MSTIPKEFFNTPQPIKDKVCEVFTKEQSPYMYDSLRQAAYYGYQLATDGREELGKEFKIKLASKQDEVNILLKESDTQIDEIYEWKEKAEALQSSLKEKEKECEQQLAISKAWQAVAEKKEKECEELKARIETMVRKLNINL